MKEFKLLNSTKEASYFYNANLDGALFLERYNIEQDIFSSYVRPKFLQEVRNQSDARKQAGYSKTKNCNFISLILVCHHSGDGEFTGHTFKKTYLIQKNNKTEDAYNIADEYGEVDCSHQAAYHVLPNGKLLEFKIMKKK